MVRLGDICKVISGSTPKTNTCEYWDGDIKWITPAELSDDSFYIYDSARHITDEGKRKTGLQAFPAGTVILSSRAPIGKTAIAGCKMCCNQGFKNLICSEYIFNVYLYFFLKGKTDFLNSLGRGATFKEISKGIVENIEIPLPSLDVQQKIAVMLIKVTDLISLRKQQISKLDELIQLRFLEFFGDPVTNPKSWRIVALSDACKKITDGTHFSPPSKNEGEFKYITAKNIKPDGFDFSNLTYISESYHREIYNRCNPEFGDVLYIKDGVTTGVAQINMLSEEFSLLSSVALLKPDRKVLSEYYLRDVLNNQKMYTHIRLKMGGAAITRLTVVKVKDIHIPLPPIDDQGRYADYAYQIDKSKSNMRKSLKMLETLKNALMQQYFG